MAKTSKKPARKAKPAAPKHEHAGQPTAYKAEYCEQARKLCEGGATDADLADAFEVSSRTIRLWRMANPEFRHACEVGKDVADDAVERSLFERAAFDGDVTAIIFWLKNRRPKLWRDRAQHELSGPDGGPIKTEGGMTDREAARMIAELLMRGVETAPAPGGTLADDAGSDA